MSKTGSKSQGKTRGKSSNPLQNVAPNNADNVATHALSCRRCRGLFGSCKTIQQLLKMVTTEELEALLHVFEKDSMERKYVMAEITERGTSAFQKLKSHLTPNSSEPLPAMRRSNEQRPLKFIQTCEFCPAKFDSTAKLAEHEEKCLKNPENAILNLGQLETSLNDSVGEPPKAKRQKSQIDICEGAGYDDYLKQKIFQTKTAVNVRLPTGQIIKACAFGQGNNDKEIKITYKNERNEARRLSIPLVTVALENPNLEDFQQFLPLSQQTSISSQNSMNDFLNNLEPVQPLPTIEEEEIPSESTKESSKIKFMKILSEAGEAETGDVYLILDGDTIIYIGRSYNAALRFYLHITNKTRSIYKYKMEHPNSTLTSVKVSPEGTSLATSFVFEGLMLKLAKELGLNLLEDDNCDSDDEWESDNNEEEAEDSKLLNKKKERIPESVKIMLQNPSDRAMIVKEMKLLIQQAIKDGVRITEEDAVQEHNKYHRVRKEDPEIKAKHNLRTKEDHRRIREDPVQNQKLKDAALSKYHDFPPGDVWPGGKTTLVDTVRPKPASLRLFLLGISEEAFSKMVVGPYTAHQFAARWGYIENSQKCKQCKEEMRFVKQNTIDCRFKWGCKHKECGKTIHCPMVKCCEEGSILKINYAGGLWNILKMLHKMAHGKTQQQIIEELGLHDMKDKKGIFEKLNNCF